jgi:ABC-type spermidine/putrescine transport system permease subunit II
VRSIWLYEAPRTQLPTSERNLSTLPIWTFSELERPRLRPATHVVAVFVIAINFVSLVLPHTLPRRAGSEEDAGR